jgi:hypothetical protein
VHVAARISERMAVQTQVVIVLLLILDQAYIQFLFRVAVDTLHTADIFEVAFYARFAAMVFYIFMAKFTWLLLRMFWRLYAFMVQVIYCFIMVKDGFDMTIIACSPMTIY